MFGSLGVPEIIFLLVLALLIFGPRKLPQIGRTLGRGLAEFRKASNELQRSLSTDDLQEELRQSDPRRILRDELSRPWRATEGPEKPSEKPPEKPESEETTAPVATAAPAATVARTKAGAGEGEADGEADAESGKTA